ncbi:hypothetical protein P170DRAFT_61333 [Aspergillus steynii IBT 23096]|uniref:Uncharacterized protein n=1 Tax=Aspergillus steynii IBT 23096 TaxID=1392250 RepID=A0A2I2FSY3_9EURO|nr:uncharacterized protein P170DRAFT_61333 [Aspergillus steynii IBT 23096]PLB43731.1 hypothetical protein P170DRAFT_61333 [Aspergillus steynii IBT 23096]
MSCDLSLAEESPVFRFAMPAILVMADNDPALSPNLADGSGAVLPAGLDKGSCGGSVTFCSHSLS